MCRTYPPLQMYLDVTSLSKKFMYLLKELEVFILKGSNMDIQINLTPLPPSSAFVCYWGPPLPPPTKCGRHMCIAHKPIPLLLVPRVFCIMFIHLILLCFPFFLSFFAPESREPTVNPSTHHVCRPGPGPESGGNFVTEEQLEVARNKAVQQASSRGKATEK